MNPYVYVCVYVSMWEKKLCSLTRIGLTRQSSIMQDSAQMEAILHWDIGMSLAFLAINSNV